MSSKKSWGGARAGAGRKKGVGTVQNQAFEAAGHDYGRTFIYMPTVEAKREMGAFDLQEIRKKSRWLTNNSGIAGGSINTITRLSVGSGLRPQARTKDRKWNAQLEEAFEAKCGTAAFGFDVAAQVNFYEAQSLVLRQILTDGDFFAQLMRSEKGAGMIRFISGEYCQSGTLVEQDGWWNGVKTNVFGRPEKFRFVENLMQPDRATDVPAADIIHLKRLYRNGYTRGVPVLHHAVNHLHDMTDILAYTKGTFKMASKNGFFLTTPDASKVTLGSGLTRTTNADGSVTIRDKFGNDAGVIQGKPGESLTPIINPHPGSSFTPFMEFLVRDIAAGFGVPPEVIWDITKAGGANMRGAFEIASYVTEELQQLLINQFCRRFWVFWVWHEIEAGRLPYPGDDWWRHDWIPPRNPTVDFTKDGKLLADLVDRGSLSPDRYYAMQGLDAEAEDESVIRRRVRREQMIQEIAGEAKIELNFEDCFPPAAGATNVNQKDEENGPEKKKKESAE